MRGSEPTTMAAAPPCECPDAPMCSRSTWLRKMLSGSEFLRVSMSMPARMEMPRLDCGVFAAATMKPWLAQCSSRSR